MLFTNVKYVISSSFPDNRQTELEKVLDANGANKVDLRQATHVITDSLQFEGFEKVSPDAAIISDEWVDRSIVFGKQLDTKLFSPDPTMIFSGVIACTVELEPCDKEVISAGINALGGLYREAFTRDCTHVLAARPGSDKYNAAMHFRETTKVRVVLPHWFDDCFKLLMRLDETPYEWPDPLILSSHSEKPKTTRITAEQKALMESSKLADSQDPAKIEALLGSKQNVWRGRKIMLSKDLMFDKRRRQTVEISVRRAGGQIITIPEGLEDDAQEAEEERGLDEADIYVTRYRHGPGYVKALRTNRTIGTLVWLFNVHKTGVISRPLDQLLHYPAPREPPEGFSSHKITISNYSGEARDYIKKLISLMDAEFTPTMTATNTVVIAAHISGNKTDKAREWSIPIVNHTWLEDCFLEWKNLTPALQKYIHYPEGINFGAMIGSRGIGQIHVDEEIEVVEARMREEKEKLLAEKHRLEEERERERLRIEKEELERAKLEREQAMKEKDRIAREGRSPMRPREIVASEQEREASEVAEVDAAIDLAGGDDSQAFEDMDFHMPTSSRSLSKRPSQAKPGPSKLPMKSARDEEEEEEEEEEEPVQRIPPPRERPKPVPAKPSTSRLKKLPSPEPEEEEEEEEEEVTKRVTRSTGRPGPSTTVNQSESKKAVRKNGPILSDDDSQNALSPPKRGRGQPRKHAIVESVASSPEDGIVANGRSKTTKGKGKSVPLVSLLQDLTDSDEGLTPIGQGAKLKKVAPSLPKISRQDPIHLTSNEEESGVEVIEVTKTGPPRKATRNAISSKNVTPQKTASIKNSKKQPSTSGSTDRKVAVVEIPSPPNVRKTTKSSGIDRTQSIVAVAADSPSSTPKRGRPVTGGRSQSPHRKGRDPSASPPQRLKEGSNLSSQRSYPLNGLQRTPSKRQAATMASLRLHETAQDMNNFQREMRNGTIRGPWEKEMKEKGKLVEDGESRKRRASSTSSAPEASLDEIEELDLREVKKRKVDPSPAAKMERRTASRRDQAENIPPPSTKRARFEREKLTEESDPPKAKRGKKELSMEIEDDGSYTVMTTKVSLNDSVQKALGKLGVKFTEKPAECNILITDGVGRTEKFLCAMSVVRQIVSIKWAEDSARLKKILPPEDYALRDPEGEKKFGMKLADALQRARSSEKKLLQGHTFYVTPIIRTGEKFDTYKKVATSAGAKISTQIPTPRMLEGHDDRHIMSSPADQHVWRGLSEEGFAVYSPELLLMGVLKQDMEWNNRTYRLDSNV